MAPIRKGDGTPLEIPSVQEVRTGDGRVFFAGDEIPDSAVAHWDFNESESSETLEDNIGDNDGTVSGVLFGEDGINDNSTSAYFDGDAEIEFNPTDLPEGDAERTTVCWFKPEEEQTTALPFAYGLDNFGEDWRHRIEGTEFAHDGHGDAQENTDSGVIRIGEWNFTAIVSDGSSHEMYVNGVLETTGSWTADTQLEYGSFGFRASRVDWYFKGWIDQTLVFDEELSDSEIDYLYQQGNV